MSGLCTVSIANLRRNETRLPNLLLALGAAGLGALLYTPQGEPVPKDAETSIHKLSHLITAAIMYDLGDEIDADDLLLLFGAGSSPGGARPKALVFDEENRTHYLAKFPSQKVKVDVVKIEAATMSLAAKAGLQVPPTKLAECGARNRPAGRAIRRLASRPPAHDQHADPAESRRLLPGPLRRPP